MCSFSAAKLCLIKLRTPRLTAILSNFFLKKVIESHHLKDIDPETKKPVETFTELTVLNSLDPKEVRRWLFNEVARIEFDLSDINPNLINLLRTKCFRMVLTTVFDPSVETLMDDVWGQGNYRIMNIFGHKDKGFDFGRDELLGDEYYDVPPTLYYIFGKADPDNPAQGFVLDDLDVVNCISKWMGRNVPEKLLSYIDTKKLMVLGCNLKDWCFRFFWYAIRHNTSHKLFREINRSKGDIALLLKTEESEQDRNLHTYLTKNIGVSIHENAHEYLQELAQQLDEEKIAKKVHDLSSKGGVFISYAGEDYHIARDVFNRLRSEGFNVWLDNDKLEVGDKYKVRIEKAISECKVFIPILSSTVASDLSEDNKRYYRKEWELATGENSNIRYCPIIVFEYNYKAEYHQKVPEKIREATVFDWSKEPFYTFISKIEFALNSIL